MRKARGITTGLAPFLMLSAEQWSDLELELRLHL